MSTDFAALFIRDLYGAWLACLHTRTVASHGHEEVLIGATYVRVGSKIGDGPERDTEVRAIRAVRVPHNYNALEHHEDAMTGERVLVAVEEAGVARELRVQGPDANLHIEALWEARVTRSRNARGKVRVRWLSRYSDSEVDASSLRRHVALTPSGMVEPSLDLALASNDWPRVPAQWRNPEW